MNREIVKKVLGTFLLTAGMSVSLQMSLIAQNRNSDVTAGANVVDAISVTGVSNLDFGDVLQGTIEEIDPAAGNLVGSNTSVGALTGDGQLGSVLVESVAGAGIQVFLTVPDVLTSDGGEHTIPFHLHNSDDNSFTNNSDVPYAYITDDVYLDNTTPQLTFGSDPVSDWWVFIDGNGDDTYRLGTSSVRINIPVPEDGDLYITIGGRVSTSPATPVASYAGSVLVEINKVN